MNSLPTNIHRPAGRSRWLLLAVVIGIALLLWPAHPARSDNFIFYFPNSHSTLPIRSFKSVQYLPMVQLLNLFGHVGSLREKKKSLKIWFGNTEITVRSNDRTVRLNNARVKLADPVQTMQGEWMVPVEFLTTILPTLINQTIEFQKGENRIFIGDVRPNSFTLHLEPLESGARLTFQFADQITLRTAAQNGKWILYLGNRPVEPVESQFSFQNPYLSSVQFDDSDGNPKLILAPAAAGLDFFPKLGQGKKVLVADIMKPGATASERKPVPPSAPAVAPGQSAAPPASVAGAAAAQAIAPGLALPVVVLDAGHGGSNTGARGNNGLLEKDLTSQLVMRVRNALVATGKYHVVLTRTGDMDVSFDQRTKEANIAHPIAFISFHAGDTGPTTPRVVVYTYHPSSPLAMAPASNPQPLFIPWDRIQVTYLDQSRQFAQQLQQDLGKTTGGAAGPAPVEAPVRILRSIAAPAVAIEVGSLAPDTDPAPLIKESFQNQIAAAVVQAVADLNKGKS